MRWELVARKVLVKALAFIVAAALLEPVAFSQNFSRLDRERAQDMLKQVTNDVRKNYYDPKLHGVDWDAKVREAKEKITHASSFDEAYLVIAAVLESLNDSHTFFIPPRRTVRVENGWRWQMIGTRCYVVQVKSGSDAEAQGVKPGDQLLTIDGFAPTRDDLWKLDYAFMLSPQGGLQVDILSPSGKLRKIWVKSRVRKTKTILDIGDVTGRDSWRARLTAEDAMHFMQVRYAEIGPELMIVKVPEFLQTELNVQGILEKARGHKTLIIDVRGCPGGEEESLANWVGGLFNHDVKIADRVKRDKTTAVMAKGTHRNAFTGRIIVLVDSSSASGAELLARLVQIERRGTVLGDHTSGATMEGIFYNHQTGIDPVYTYEALVTQADLVMTDGKRLEHVGVMPDEIILPTATDLANGLDPVLAHAAEIAGVKLDSARAAKLFPPEWPPDPAYAF